MLSHIGGKELERRYAVDRRLFGDLLDQVDRTEPRFDARSAGGPI
jgi:hypothetical protein